MRLFDLDFEEGLLNAEKVDAKYKPVFDKYGPKERAALARYFLPHKSRKEVLSVTRPRLIKWYCPFADQKQFPTGHRYCINVYTGCSHQCSYCYAQGYEPDQAKCKQDYKKKLLKDLADLRDFDLPPAPLHMSNSTDPLQPLEQQQRLTLYTLQQLQKYRRYFSTIVIITKNPVILTEPEYLRALKPLASVEADHPGKKLFCDSSPPLRIEASLAFCDEDSAAFYDPGAPTVSQRMAAIATLRRNDIPVVMRIDPLLPRDPLPGGKSLADFQLPNAQSLDGLEKLAAFAADNKILHIVYSVAKVVSPRYKPLGEEMQNIKKVYEHLANGEKLIFRGGSWRLPNDIAQEQIIEPFKNICHSYNLKTCYCKQNLLATP
jgi:DNA repair photolyase